AHTSAKTRAGFFQNDAKLEIDRAEKPQTPRHRWYSGNISMSQGRSNWPCDWQGQVLIARGTYQIIRTPWPHHAATIPIDRGFRRRNGSCVGGRITRGETVPRSGARHTAVCKS